MCLQVLFGDISTKGDAGHLALQEEDVCTYYYRNSVDLNVQFIPCGNHR